MKTVAPTLPGYDIRFNQLSAPIPPPIYFHILLTLEPKKTSDHMNIAPQPIYFEIVYTKGIPVKPDFIRVCHSLVVVARPAIRDTFGAVECHQY